MGYRAFSASMNAYFSLTDTPGRRRLPPFPRTPFSFATHGLHVQVLVAVPAPIKSPAAHLRHARSDTCLPRTRESPHEHLSPAQPRHRTRRLNHQPRRLNLKLRTILSAFLLHPSTPIPEGTLLGPLSGIWEARHSA